MRALLCLLLAVSACSSDPESVPADSALDHVDAADVPVPYDADVAPMTQDAYGPLDASIDAR